MENIFLPLGQFLDRQVGMAELVDKIGSYVVEADFVTNESQ
jgi:hypothetical protein